MKKTIHIVALLFLTISLIACSNTTTLENDFAKDKETLKTMQNVVNEFEKQEDVKSFKYDSGNIKKGSAKFISGDCAVTIYAQANNVLKLLIKDNKKSSLNRSDDFIACINGSLKLSMFDLNVATHNKIIESFNNGLNGKDNINGYTIEMNKNTFTIYNQTEDTLLAAVPITIEEIEMIDFKCLPSDSTGTVYMQTQFKNNADEIIGSISYTYKVDDKTTYLSCQKRYYLDK